jgi:hypothetical protein
MIFTPLWHTEFLLDIENKEGNNIRFLVDTWLSDYVTWDLMERGTRVRLDHASLATIDYIYISHAHTDHFDPYMLIEIYAHANPVLILPNTLQYLEWLIREYIPQIEIVFLSNRRMIELSGIEVMGIMFEQDDITNEDDVMCISFANQHELLFAEIDTLPPETDEVSRILSRLMTKREYATIAYIATRNELEGNLKILDFPTVKERENFRREYVHSRKEEIEWQYEQWQYDDTADRENIMTIPGFVRGYIGQGIVYPRSLSPELAWLTALSLEEVFDRESAFALQYGYDFPQKVLLPGRQYRLEAGAIEVGRKECPIATLDISRDKTPITTPAVRAYAQGALLENHEWTPEYESIILNVLNTLFLPYWSASPTASLRSALMSHPEWRYVIEMIGNDGTRYFEYTLSGVWFILGEKSLNPNESYFLGDIIDFLEGRQELYSNFWHKLDPKKLYRLWTCLGANYCNNERVLKKYRLHFERAKMGETATSFFAEMTQNLK